MRDIRLVGTLCGVSTWRRSCRNTKKKKTIMKTKTHIHCEYVEKNISKTIEFDHVQKHAVHMPQAVRLCVPETACAPPRKRYRHIAQSLFVA
jgi:hypothetical protein